MVDLGCQDTYWVGGNVKEVLDAILLLDGLILATLSMDKGKCGYLGCISCWFGALRGASRVTDGLLSVSGNDRGIRCNFTLGWAHTNHFKQRQRKMWSSWGHFWLVRGPEGGP